MEEEEEEVFGLTLPMRFQMFTRKMQIQVLYQCTSFLVTNISSLSM
jgi:hypothetical protein